MDSDRAFQPTPIAEPSLSTAFASRTIVGTTQHNDSGAESVYLAPKGPSVALSGSSTTTARIILMPEVKLVACRCATSRGHPFRASPLRRVSLAYRDAGQIRQQRAFAVFESHFVLFVLLEKLRIDHRLQHVVPLETGTGWDQPAHDHVLLQAA